MYIGYGHVIHCMGNICVCVIRGSVLIRLYVHDYSFIFMTNVKITKGYYCKEKSG